MVRYDATQLYYHNKELALEIQNPNIKMASSGSIEAAIIYSTRLPEINYKPPSVPGQPDHPPWINLAVSVIAQTLGRQPMGLPYPEKPWKFEDWNTYMDPLVAGKYSFVVFFPAQERPLYEKAIQAFSRFKDSIHGAAFSGASIKMNLPADHERRTNDIARLGQQFMTDVNNLKSAGGHTDVWENVIRMLSNRVFYIPVHADPAEINRWIVMQSEAWRGIWMCYVAYKFESYSTNLYASFVYGLKGFLPRHVTDHWPAYNDLDRIKMMLNGYWPTTNGDEFWGAFTYISKDWYVTFKEPKWHPTGNSNIDAMTFFVQRGQLPVGLRVPRRCQCPTDLSSYRSWMPNFCERHMFSCFSETEYFEYKPAANLIASEGEGLQRKLKGHAQNSEVIDLNNSNRKNFGMLTNTALNKIARDPNYVLVTYRLNGKPVAFKRPRCAPEMPNVGDMVVIAVIGGRGCECRWVSPTELRVVTRLIVAEGKYTCDIIVTVV